MHISPSVSASTDQTTERPRVEIGHLSPEQVAELLISRIDFSNLPGYDDVHIRHAAAWAMVFLENGKTLFCLTRHQCAAVRTRLKSEAAR